MTRNHSVGLTIALTILAVALVCPVSRTRMHGGVIVTDSSSRRASGTYAAIQADSLVFRSDGAPVAVGLDRIHYLEVRRGTRRPDALLPALGGGLLGGAVAYIWTFPSPNPHFRGDPDSLWRLISGIGGAVIGTAAGYVVSRLVNVPAWQPVVIEEVPMRNHLIEP